MADEGGGSGPRIYLAGLSGSGKSTVAGLLGRWLGCPSVDVDREVERAAGRSIAEIWTADGEAAFRALERAALERLMETRAGPRILALGGGTLEDEDARQRLARWGAGVHLDGSPEALAGRAAEPRGSRPLLATGEPVAVLEALAVRRGAGFAALPHRVETDGRSPAGVAVEVLRRAGVAGGARQIAPDVRFGRGLLGGAGELLAERLSAAPRGELVTVTDPVAWSFHGPALAAGLERGGWSAVPCLLAPGEAAKSTAGLEAIWRALLERGADRDTPALVLGGGAAGDVGGMAAATFKRGIPLALFPTTLLAQADAAIGGKNAIDFGGIKNVVGAFHAPVLVGVDSFCPLTLPDRDWTSGWAEIVKAGLIGDPALLALCEGEAAAIAARRLDVVEEALERAIRVKLAVVHEDPREAGRRRVLNLGHTLGHAFEAAGRGRWSHGEAVAMGLVAEARLAERAGIAEKGLAERIEALLAGLGLPTATAAGLDADAARDALRHDKKRAGGRAHVPLPVRPGEVRIVDLEPHALDSALLDLS